MDNSNKWYEKETFQSFWEKGYRDKKVSTMGGPSVEVYEILPFLPKNARVLDLGCGEGRNSIFLANNGCVVTAIDHSAAAIEKVKLAAEKLGLVIEAYVGDLATLKIDKEYDLVMAHGVLYYLEKDEWKRLLENIKDKTLDGGFNIFTLFIFDEEYPALDEIAAAGYKFSFEPEELKEFYND
ncbi:MAG: methyltransferase domain-containing protein, partial [Clostridium sp.]